MRLEFAVDLRLIYLLALGETAANSSKYSQPLLKLISARKSNSDNQTALAKDYLMGIGVVLSTATAVKLFLGEPSINLSE
jgi:hypothetical protein